MRLIDAHVLKDKLVTLENTTASSWAEHCIMWRIHNIIDNLLTEKVESIVRCKDCKFYPDGEGTTKWVPCREIVTPPNWYCADGERKKDDAT